MPRELHPFALWDHHIITWFLYALATGTIDIDWVVLIKSPDHQSQFLVCFVVAELMVCCLLRKPGYFQSMLMDQLSIQLPSWALTNFCSAFCAIGNYSLTNHGKDQLAMEWFGRGKTVGWYDLFMFGGDNVQFRKRGRACGCVPWTIVFNMIWS